MESGLVVGTIGGGSTGGGTIARCDRRRPGTTLDVSASACCSSACAFLAFAGPCRSAPPVAAPGYVLADGSIRIVAEKTMEPVLSRLNTLMTRRHPELRFRMIFGDVPVGLDGIIARVSLFAPLAHDAWESEIDPFKRLNGYRPLDVRIGRLGHAGSGRANLCLAKSRCT